MASAIKLILYTWSTSVVFQTIYLFSKCFKSFYNTWSGPKQAFNPLKVFHKVLFFPDNKLICHNFFSSKGCHFKTCRNAHYKTSLGELLDFLNDAKMSLDICVFTISCHELANAALKLHETGVAVRVITNEEHEALTGSQIERFQSEGIQVRHDKTSFYMHHKFVIVDGSVLITGSFNWTRQAVMGNRENVLVTNNPEIVGPYLAEYEKLWKSYKPVKTITQKRL